MMEANRHTQKAAGDWDGWNFCVILACRYLAKFQPAPEANHLVPSGESPLSHTLPAGQRVYLVKTSEPVSRSRRNYRCAIDGWARVADPERR